MNSETDFVAKNDLFLGYVNDLANHLIAKKPATVEEALEQTMENGTTVAEFINAAISKIGEKISLRRFAILEKSDNDAFGAYQHMGGRISALTLLEGTTDEAVAKDVAMHVAAINPKYVHRDEVPEAEVNREKEILTKEALNEGKPENIVEKIVQGRLNKYFEEVCLLTIKNLLKIRT